MTTLNFTWWYAAACVKMTAVGSPPRKAKTADNHRHLEWKQPRVPGTHHKEEQRRHTGKRCETPAHMLEPHMKGAGESGMHRRNRGGPGCNLQ